MHSSYQLSSYVVEGDYIIASKIGNAQNGLTRIKGQKYPLSTNLTYPLLTNLTQSEK